MLALHALVVASALGASVGAERPITTSTLQPPVTNETQVAVAGGNGGWLAAWRDSRRCSNCGDIYVARLSPIAGVLDGSGIVLGRADMLNDPPAVSFDGTNFLVVWSPSSNTPALIAARVSAAGVVLAPGEFPLTAQTGGHVSATFGGGAHLVVWDDTRAVPQRTYFARIAPSGMILDVGGVPVSPAGTAAFSSEIAASATQALVVWRGGSDIVGSRVTFAGQVLDPAGITAVVGGPRSHYSPRAASDGTTFLVTWETPSGGVTPRYDVSAVRVTSAGAVQAPIVPVAMKTSDERSLAVAFGPTDYTVLWSDDATGVVDLMASRITTAGALLDANGVQVSTTVNDRQVVSAALAWDGARQLAVWDAWPSGRNGGDVVASRLSSTATPVDAPAIAVSRSAPSQRQAAIAFDGARFLVVWNENNDLRAARIDRDGAVADPNGFSVSSAATFEGRPAVAFGGTQYLVVWTDGRTNPARIRCARVAPDGTLLDPATLPLGSAGGDGAAVGSNGSQFFAAWNDKRMNIYGQLYGARVDATGAVQDPAGISLQGAGVIPSAVAVAFGGGNYAVGWTDADLMGNAGIWATRVTPAGAVLDPTGSPLATPRTTQTLGGFTTFSGGFFSVWGDYVLLAQTRTWRVGRAPTSTGATLDGAGVVIAAPGMSLTGPRLAFDGALMQVVWAEDVGGLAQLRGQTVSTSTAPVGTAFTIGPAVQGLDDVVIASAQDGAALVVSSRFDSTPGVGNFRLFARFFSSDGGAGTGGGAGGGAADGGGAGGGAAGGGAADGGGAAGGGAAGGGAAAGGGGGGAAGGAVAAGGGAAGGSVAGPLDLRAGCACSGSGLEVAALLALAAALSRLRSGRARPRP